MAGKPNAAELEMLTDEEREGMLDEDTVDEGLEDGDDAGEDDAAADDKAGEGAGQEGKDKPDAADGEDGDDDAAEGADIAADAAAKAKQEADAKTAADAAAAGGDEKNAAARAAAEPKPLEGDKRPSWALDPKVPEQIDALEKQKDELTDKFDDGEFTGKEFRAEMRKIDAQLDALKEQRISSNVARNTAIIEYRDVTIPTFLSEHPEYKPGTVLHRLLDAEVKQLQMQSNNPFNPAILERAHQNISDQVSKAYGAKPAVQAKPKAAAAAREVVPTLGTVPAADANDTDGGGEFAWLDRLANADVEKYEQELAKLSDEKRERYLAE